MSKTYIHENCGGEFFIDHTEGTNEVVVRAIEEDGSDGKLYRGPAADHLSGEDTGYGVKIVED